MLYVRYAFGECESGLPVVARECARLLYLFFADGMFRYTHGYRGAYR